MTSIDKPPALTQRSIHSRVVRNLTPVLAESGFKFKDRFFVRETGLKIESVGFPQTSRVGRGVHLNAFVRPLSFDRIIRRYLGDAVAEEQSRHRRTNCYSLKIPELEFTTWDEFDDRFPQFAAGIMEKCLPWFDALLEPKDFIWHTVAFERMEDILAHGLSGSEEFPGIAEAGLPELDRPDSRWWAVHQGHSDGMRSLLTDLLRYGPELLSV
jgi:hypothetical protein